MEQVKNNIQSYFKGDTKISIRAILLPTICALCCLVRAPRSHSRQNEVALWPDGNSIWYRLPHSQVDNPRITTNLRKFNVEAFKETSFHRQHEYTSVRRRL